MKFPASLKQYSEICKLGRTRSSAPKNTVQQNFAISENGLNNIDFSSPETIADDIYNTLVLFLGERAFTFDRSILEKNVVTILEREIGVEKSHDVHDFSSDDSKLNFLNQVIFFMV